MTTRHAAHPSDRFSMALATLSKETLIELALAFGLPGIRAAASKAEHAAALSELAPKRVLAMLKRDDLKAMCRGLALDDGGREKEPLVKRILGALAKQRGPQPVSLRMPSPAPAPAKAPRAKGAKAATLSLEAESVSDYRHDETRKNNPPAGLVEFDKPPKKKKKEYAYDPHLDPQLQWAGKAEHTSFEVDTVSLHIHERISTQAILRAVKREEQQLALNLFAKPELPSSKEIDFYHHEVGWANRLVLGDSLLVMNSLLERENMGGQVQCVYMDPPYGISFASNFQPAVSKKMVKDDDESLSREPEQIQAYRDTWELGIHSYLTYLRDRLLLAHALLAKTGSIFVQISDENVHTVRALLDEVFGASNFVAQICYRTSVPLRASGLAGVYDIILWYAVDRNLVKYRPLFVKREEGEKSRYSNVETPDGQRRSLTEVERADPSILPAGSKLWSATDLASSGYTATCTFDFDFNGKTYRTSSGKSWKTTREGLTRLARAGRISDSGKTIRYVLFLEDYPVQRLTNLWADTTGEQNKQYVVQTHTRAIERCILMASDPGDLIFDPTCGSGTTASVAEQFGRRWITSDTSRVALTIARQRLITGRYPFYELRSPRVRDGFRYQTASHITLGSIAQNPKIDAAKSRADVERVIRESAEQETLYDQPFEDRSKVRVSGPFTVEAIPLASMEDPSRDIDGATSTAASVPGHFSDEVGSYLDYMTDLLRQTGVQFPGNKRLRFPNLAGIKGAFEWLHAEGHSDLDGDPKRYAVSFGPRHGPVSPTQVIDGMREARGYDALLFFGFACDPEARKVIDQGSRTMELHFVNAAPDILVGDLLKKRKTDQLFTVFGAPDVVAHREQAESGATAISIELVGIDLYDPTTGETHSAKGAEAAAIFVDHDYDGKSFCVSQALFPGGGANAWEKLQKALKGSIDEDKFEQLRTTRSLPFSPGHRVAVKVIDDRGNEVIKLVDPKKAR